MSYIYFIQAQGNGPIKIGFTGFNPRKRMVKIRSDCPWPVRLLGAIEGTVSQEKQIHLVLSRYKTQGEWFEPHPIVLAAVNVALECGTLAPDRKAIDPNAHPLKIWRHSQKPRKTLASLARDIGVTTGHLSSIENWKDKPSMRVFALIRGVTGIEFDQFVRSNPARF